MIKDGITVIGDYVFSGCSTLESFSISNTVSVIGASAFDGCENAEFNTDLSHVTSIGNRAFGTCRKLETVCISEDATGLDSCAFIECSGLKKVVISDGFAAIGTAAFSGCTSLEEVEIPVDVKCGALAFENCASIKNIKYTKGSTGVFSNSLRLAALEVRANQNTEGEYTVVFADGVVDLSSYSISSDTCENLKSVWFGNAIETIGDNSFQTASVPVFYGKADSIVETYADAKNISFIPYDVTMISSADFTLESVPAPGGNLPKDVNTETVGINTESIQVKYYDPSSTEVEGAASCNTVYSMVVSFEPEDGYRFANDFTMTLNGKTISANNQKKSCSFEVVFPATSHGSTEIRNAKEATCTATGYTGDTYCTICGDLLKAGDTIAVVDHTVVTDSEKAPTCTETGLTAGSHCEVCGTVLTAQTEIPASGHTEVTDPAVPATCTEPGLTAGSHCSVCHEVLVAQQEVPAPGHNWDDGVVTKVATETEDGEIEYTCQTCQAKKTETIVINVGESLAGHSISLEGNVGINFFFELSDEILADEGAYVRFTLPDGSTHDVYVNPQTDPNVSVAEKDTTSDPGKTLYMFQCQVAAKEMTESVTAQMIRGDGRSGKAHTYEVKDYADYMEEHLDGNTQYQKAYDLVCSMLNLGSYSQVYFGENITELANADSLTEEQTAEISAVDAAMINHPYDASEESLPEGVRFMGSDLELESETILNLYFENTNNLNLTFETADGRQLKTKKVGDLTQVVISDIVAQDLSDDIVVKVLVDGGDDGFSMKCSPMNYCYNVLSRETTATRTEELKDLIRALFVYNQKAVAYFGN